MKNIIIVGYDGRRDSMKNFLRDAARYNFLKKQVEENTIAVIDEATGEDILAESLDTFLDKKMGGFDIYLQNSES